jgi:hypothetical protein
MGFSSLDLLEDLDEDIDVLFSYLEFLNRVIAKFFLGYRPCPLPNNLYFCFATRPIQERRGTDPPHPF